MKSPAEILREGGIVIFPTETVYGIGANALRPDSVARIFELKGRPSFNPLIVHVASLTAAAGVARFSPAALALAEAFWPGPLSLVLPKHGGVADLVTAGLDTVGVRVPAHPKALELLQEAGVPVAAPSANLSNRLSPTESAHLADLANKVDAVVEGGACAVGVESTIVGFADGIPTLLRPGGLEVERIEAVLGRRLQRPAAGVLPNAPGQLAVHYSPRTPSFRAEPGTAAPGKRFGLLCLAPPDEGLGYARIEALSASGNLAEAATALFAALRRLDAAGLEGIVAWRFPPRGLGLAIDDRLERAAAGKRVT